MYIQHLKHYVKDVSIEFPTKRLVLCSLVVPKPAQSVSSTPLLPPLVPVPIICIHISEII